MLTASSEPACMDGPPAAMMPPGGPETRQAAISAIDCVRVWTEEEFAAAGPAWGALLARSDADPYFMGWDRQWLWWQHHKVPLRGRLSIIACYAGRELVGLAPLYLRAATHRSVLRANRLEMIGSAFRAPGVVFSEYLDLIADRACTDAVVGAVARHLLDDDRWSDLVIANSPAEGAAAAMVRWHLGREISVREVDPLESYRVALPSDFAIYLASLTSGARRKIWNHRAKLRDAELAVADAENVGQVFDLLEGFHQRRWKAPMYAGVGRAFHDDLTAVMVQRGALRMSTLYSAGQPIAAMHNIRIGETEYNIRTGFDADFVAGVSPGYLHFGYCLEAASRDGIRQFDFLAGEGRHRQYKKDFGATEFPLRTFHALRSPQLKLMYRAYDALTGLRLGRTRHGASR